MAMTEEERKAKAAAYDREYRAAHREERRLYNLQWRKEHPDNVKTWKAKWQRANPQKRYDNSVSWAKKNPEKARINKVLWRKANHEKALAADARQRRAHPEQRRLNNAKWAHTHPETRRLMRSKRRALQYANTPADEMLTSTEWLSILAEAHGHCHYCDKEAKLTLDHVIPLSKGGKHSKDNVVPACGHCNNLKHDKTPQQWAASRSTT